MPFKIHKPKIPALSVAAAAARDWRGWLLQEKSDGTWQPQTITAGGAALLVNAEAMPGGGVVVNDLIAIDDAPARLGAAERWQMLSAWADALPHGWRLARALVCTDASRGREFIAAETGANGPADVVVCKPLAAPFGVAWEKVKIELPSLVTVAGLDMAKGVAVIVDRITGAARGRVKLPEAVFCRVRVGDGLKVVSAGIHEKSGLLREARFEAF